MSRGQCRDGSDDALGKREVGGYAQRRACRVHTRSVERRRPRRTRHRRRRVGASDFTCQYALPAPHQRETVHGVSMMPSDARVLVGRLALFTYPSTPIATPDCSRRARRAPHITCVTNRVQRGHEWTTWARSVLWTRTSRKATRTSGSVRRQTGKTRDNKGRRGADNYQGGHSGAWTILHTPLDPTPKPCANGAPPVTPFTAKRRELKS